MFYLSVSISVPYSTSDIHHSTVSSTDVQSPPTVLCDFCGQLFDTRKALSCHARAHLRQLGLTWSIKSSPINLLKEVMMQGVAGRRESAPSGSSGKTTWSPQGSRRSLDRMQKGEPDSRPCTSPLDYSMKDKSLSSKGGAAHPGDNNNLMQLFCNSSILGTMMVLFLSKLSSFQFIFILLLFYQENHTEIKNLLNVTHLLLTSVLM